jgi:hypothetical protein
MGQSRNGSSGDAGAQQRRHRRQLGAFEMKFEMAPLNRRALLGAAMASAVLPRLAVGQTRTSTSGAEGTNMKIRIAFNGQSFTATLYENPSARDLVSILPLDLTIDDYANNEKIAYLPRKLTEEGARPFSNEAPGDLCYFVPWGNLAFFYDSYRYSDGLIRLGRLDNGVEPLLMRGEFPLRVELLA